MRILRLGLVLYLLTISLLSFAQKTQGFARERDLGSAYLPLNHWGYAAVERAIAKGAIPGQFMGQRPWTRMAIADLLEMRLRNPDAYAQDEQSQEIVATLDKEFAAELQVLEGDDVSNLQVESLYTRSTEVAGHPLRDGFHLGQTIVNDFGRPYGDGFNNVTGLSLSADWNMFTVYGSGEFQRSADGTYYSSAANAALAVRDAFYPPTAGSKGQPLIYPDNHGVAHGGMQDTYIGGTWHGWDISAGKESLWWGTSVDSALTMTNNAEPMAMGKIDRTVPFHFPWIFKYLGQARMTLFMGRLEGHYYPPGPWLHGEKISLMPTKDLEIGLARTTVWLGQGRPFTFHRLLSTYFSVGDQASSPNSAANDPGDRRGELDLRYRLPKLRNYATYYFDSLVDDDPSPLAAPQRAAFRQGILLTQLPGLSKFDFRTEVAYTELDAFNRNGQFFYWNIVYHDSYTNSGMLLGDWVGREGIGGESDLRYWFTPKTYIQASYRRNQLATDFIPGGGLLQDASVQTMLHVKGDVYFTGMVQYEHYNFPILGNGPQNNVATSVGFTIYPGAKTRTPQQ